MQESIPAELREAFGQERSDARLQVAAVRSKAPTELRALSVRMYVRLAQRQQEVVSQENVQIACARGCAYCCHLRVEVRPHEVFVLAQHIQSTFDDTTRARLTAKLDENVRRIAPLSAEQHIRAGIACAMLEEGVCSVYEARPATCRKYHSLSVDTCRDAYNDTAAPLTGPLEHNNLRLTGNATVLGFAKGIEEAGLNADMVELQFALKLALESDKPEKRYRAGKKPFI